MKRELPADGIERAFIYALLDPETLEVRYIGKTNNPRARLRQHIHEKKVSHRANWIKSLIARGVEPVMEIIEEHSQSSVEAWQEAEEFYIRYLRFLGCNLTNHTDLSIAGFNRSEETKEKLRIAALSRAPEVAAKISATLTGRKATPETIAKLKAIRNTPEFKKKISISKKGFVYSEQAKKNMGEGHRGFKFSEESKRKMSLAKLGRPFSESHRAKLSEVRKGKPTNITFSPEVRQKISQARLRHEASLTPEQRQARRAAQRQIANLPEVSAKRSASMAKLSKDPAYRAKVSEGVRLWHQKRKSTEISAAA